MMAARRRLFSAAAFFSASIAVLSWVGYFISGSLTISYSKNLLSPEYVLVPTIGDGLIGGDFATIPPAGWVGLTVHPEAFWKLASLRDSGWNFDFEHTQSRISPVYTFFVPLWCVWLPCLILPVLWLKKRWLKPQHARGFEVHQPGTSAVRAAPPPDPLEVDSPGRG